MIDQPFRYPTMFTNRRNAKKPDGKLIENFQTKFSDLVRPTPNHLLPARFYMIGGGIGPTPNICVTPIQDDTSLPAAKLRKRNSYDRTLNRRSIVSNSPAGDLLTPSGRTDTLLDQALFDQFTNNTPRAQPDNTGLDQFGVSSSMLQPQYVVPSSLDGSHSLQDSTMPFPVDTDPNGSVDGIAPGDNTKHSYPSSHMVDGMLDSAKLPGMKSEKLRYRMKMHTPTAMIRDRREAPVTYLNKGQTYWLSVVDSMPPPLGMPPTRYRTSVRITFDEEAQVSDPVGCWQLWKEVRGQREASQQGRGLQAVEFLSPEEGTHSQRQDQVRLENVSLDGFCVSWTASPGATIPQCKLGVRFNFLSTDFTHSKGVKGSSVRLCAKTETVPAVDPYPEMSYCKVKLFRDHGAERKISSDVCQMKKAIDKLKNEMALSGAGADHLGKRKRDSSSASKSASDAKRNERQLASMESSLSSTLPVTTFNLLADQRDDPDWYPILLPELERKTSPSDLRRHSVESLQHLSKAGSLDPSSPSSLTTPPSLSPTGITTEQFLPRDLTKSGNLPSKPSEPAACFYIRFYDEWKVPESYHRALYLTERTVRNLTTKICQTQGMDPESVARALHVNPSGLRIMIDDDVVQQIPDGQPMMVEIISPSPTLEISPGAKAEFEIILSY
ncbi:uncharacterized protein BDW47DRAFT_102595 [Aspergillus candidus]|uniref:Grh/CP2 DB domain-containing protein n=1 Tax=Aspergillus candidus TaxID=41067 RepID=A0A2I2FGV0_ASPCN|nr:hypothetical protein BDW47DRAFT_102595 [Aspergillus candidus]PLB39867.1 hypothetical protein BDW47DRAFT_102595 [Aspergillus candidus]